MNRTIYFDMDGTLAGLFYVKDFSKRLANGDVGAYTDAPTLYDETAMADVIAKLIAKGYKIGIISYVSTTPKAARVAKKEWLKKHFNYATEIHIIQEYTTKYAIANDKNGILVDDARKNREAWKGQTINAYHANLVEELSNLL